MAHFYDCKDAKSPILNPEITTPSQAVKAGKKIYPSVTTVISSTIRDPVLDVIHKPRSLVKFARMEEHEDKDEKLYAETGEVSYPICSAILYLRIENLVGAKLRIVRDNIEIEPKPGMLVLLAPGVTHSITEYSQGTRISLNLNIWDRPLNKS